MLIINNLHPTIKILIIVLFIAKTAIPNDEFHQSKYKAVFQRANVLWFDKELIPILSIKNHKLNRTIYAASAVGTIAKMLQTCRVEYIIYKFLQNEYKRTGIQSSIDICRALKNNYYGIANIKKSSNLTDCPIAKGTYVVHDFVTDSDKFPPLIPGGEYKGVLTFIVNNNKACVLEAYGNIIYPPLWKH